MLLDRIVWRDGWPRFDDQAPSIEARSGPARRR
jgi:hypothetical protein